ncbi:MAG: NAD(P)H-dependent glycerol-3-phosphate dehydrogenase [Candidatus Saccharimonas aalborgensis]
MVRPRTNRQRAEVTVIGAGTFGHAIADSISRSEIRTALVTRSETRLERIRQMLARSSPYLMAQRLGDAPLGKYVFLALPSADIAEVVGRLASYHSEETLGYVSLSKGLTAPDGETPHELLSRRFGSIRSAVISGPSLADEMPKHGAHFVVASSSHTLADKLVLLMDGEYTSATGSNDPTGIEWAGITKNAVTLGFHACLAATGSLNQAGAFAGQLFTEIYDYALTMGASPRSFAGIAGIGDLMATSHASTSRNVRAGQLIGSGHSVGEAEARIKQVVESLHTIPLLERRINQDHAATTTPTITALSNRIVGNLAHEQWIASLTSR